MQVEPIGFVDGLDAGKKKKSERAPRFLTRAGRRMKVTFIMYYYKKDHKYSKA